MFGKLLDMYREEARRIRVGMQTGTVVDDTKRPSNEPRKEDAGGLSPEAYAEYQRVAAKVGFAPRGINSHALRDFLSECGIRVYPLEKVQEYLDQQYGAPRFDAKWGGPVATWVWKPLRASDKEGAQQFSHYVRSGVAVAYRANGAIAKTERVYGKPLPLPVLLTVERIVDRFPGAQFFVSDDFHAPPITDPFLAVVYGEDSDPVVVERWDEPRFRG